MEKQPPQDRRMDGVVEDLISHVEWKLSMLPRLARGYRLSQESIDFMKGNLEEELEYLHSFPPDTTISDLMRNHFDNSGRCRTVFDGHEYVGDSSDDEPN